MLPPRVRIKLRDDVGIRGFFCMTVWRSSMARMGSRSISLRRERSASEHALNRLPLLRPAVLRIPSSPRVHPRRPLARRHHPTPRVANMHGRVHGQSRISQKPPNHRPIGALESRIGCHVRLDLVRPSTRCVVHRARSYRAQFESVDPQANRLSPLWEGPRVRKLQDHAMAQALGPSPEKPQEVEVDAKLRATMRWSCGDFEKIHCILRKNSWPRRSYHK